MQNHRNLIVWQKAHALSVRVYRVARRIARVDRAGLASQIRRASRSVPANIAEGCSRSSNRDFANFLQIAIASASELEDYLHFAQDVDMLFPNEAALLREQTVEVRRMLYGLLKRVQDENGDGG
ncbi:MAG: four helix bundle protein [Gemmatimonadaceae bacterium]